MTLPPPPLARKGRKHLSADALYTLVREGFAKVGKGVASHSLPVVAGGLIPSIYRRAAFPHRATPGPDAPCGAPWPRTEWPRWRNSLELTLGWVPGSH